MPIFSEILSNKTLCRAVQRHMGADFVISDELQKLFVTINDQFNHLDNDRALIERSMDISGQELTQANDKLRAESQQSKLLLEKLHESLSALNQFDESISSADILTLADILRDQIQRRISAEKQVNLLHEHSQQIIDTAMDAVICSDEFGFITEWNITAEKLFGWRKSDVLGLKLVETVIPKRFSVVVNKAMEDFRINKVSTIIGKRLELTAQNKFGESFPIEFSISAVNTESGIIFTSFIRDITERNKSEGMLIEAKVAAESANRAKTAFLSSMTHELRTPLNAIIGFSQLLMKDNEIPNSKRESIEIMYNSAHHLLDMINEVLDISKIESGKVELSLDAFYLDSIVNQMRNTFEMKCKNKGIQLTVSCTEDVPKFLHGDIVRIRQILINILSNAVKFTAYGTISLSISLDGYTDQDKPIIRFEISDTGRGIPPEQQDSIFEPFKQVTGLHSEGTGLGLAICKKIVMMMDGEIGLLSSVGKGTTFTIILPLSVATIHHTNNTSNELQTYTLNSDKITKVLIVDDIENNRTLLTLLLQKVGFTCLQAVNGKQAVDLCAAELPDLILMDIQMPIMGGIEAMKIIRATDVGCNIPIIAVTASGFGHLRDALIHDGFSAYIRKPFKEQLLLETIEHVTDITFNKHYQILEKTPSHQHITSKVSSIAEFIHSLDINIQAELIGAIEVQDFPEIQLILSNIGDVSLEHQQSVKQLMSVIESYDYTLLIELSKKIISDF